MDDSIDKSIAGDRRKDPDTEKARDVTPTKKRYGRAAPGTNHGGGSHPMALTF